VLIALRDILLGQEVTAGYRGEALLASKQERHRALEQQFGHPCLCEACERPDFSASDLRLERAREIQERYNNDQLAFAFDRGRALNELEWTIKALEEEGKIGLLGAVLQERIIVYAMWGQRDETIRAAKEHVKYCRLTMGELRARRMETNEWVLHPENHWAWREALDANGRKVVSVAQACVDRS